MPTDKINIGLDVAAQRGDGYHEIATRMASEQCDRIGCMRCVRLFLTWVDWPQTLSFCKVKKNIVFCEKFTLDHLFMSGFRIGHGFDVHRLAEGVPLVIGGVRMAHEKGCVAHSDGDVLLHAVCDALLGAAALGDIGLHFPDTDDAYRGIDSLVLLRRTVALLREAGYRIGNVDATLLLQRPKLRPHIDRMREILAGAMEIDAGEVSVKATTSEGLGFEGREEGISAHAVVLIYTHVAAR